MDYSPEPTSEVAVPVHFDQFPYTLVRRPSWLLTVPPLMGVWTDADFATINRLLSEVGA